MRSDSNPLSNAALKLVYFIIYVLPVRVIEHLFSVLVIISIWLLHILSSTLFVQCDISLISENNGTANIYFG